MFGASDAAAGRTWPEGQAEVDVRGNPEARRPLCVLVLDAHTRAGLAAVRALGRAGMPVAVTEYEGAPPSCGARSRWAVVRDVVPPYAADPDRFVDALLEVVDRRGPDVVLPVDDGTVAALRTRRQEFGGRTRLALASEAALQAAVDKRATLEAARALGIPVPRGMVVVDPSELDAVEAALGFPAVVKPAQSWAPNSGEVGRLTCRVVTTRADLVAAVARITEAGTAAVVQQWLSGRREAVHVLYAGGRVRASCALVAHRMLPPIGGNSIVRESIPLPPDTADAAARLVSALDLEGYAEVEFRRDAGGRAFLMEINPRLSASVEVAIRAGVDFPALLCRWAAGCDVAGSDGYRAGVRMRWLGGDLRWLRQTISSPPGPDVPPWPRAVGTFAGAFLTTAAYDYLDVHDLRPVLVAARQDVRHLRRRAWPQALNPSVPVPARELP